MRGAVLGKAARPDVGLGLSDGMGQAGRTEPGSIFHLSERSRESFLTE
jgi:hypothetical protein